MSTSNKVNRLNVMLVDDHTLFAEGLARVLSSHVSSPEIALFDNGHAALSLLTTTIGTQQTTFDIALVDLDLPDIGGTDLIKSLRNRNVQIPVLVISGSQNEEEIQRALNNGANGFAPKTSDSNTVIDAIHKVISGDIYLPDELWTRLNPFAEAVESKELSNSAAQAISSRQKEVLALLERGYSNARIADLLGISVATVKTHLVSLFRALNANNRTECVRVAREMRLID